MPAFDGKQLETAASSWPLSFDCDRGPVSARAARPAHAEAEHAASHRSTDENETRRTVLMIASRFPPVASVGATRVRKFAKYLGRFGWDPVVITGAAGGTPTSAQDARCATDLDSLLDLPDGLSLHRLSAVLDHWPGHLSRTLSGSLGRCTRRLGIDEGRWNGFFKWRLQRLHDRLAFPDRGIWRLPSTVKLAIRLHRRHRFDAIFSTGMPFSDHLIALALQSILRLPWLADFRDPWVEYVHWKQWQSDWGRRLTRAAERAVTCRAAHVISVNDPMTRRFRARYADQAAAKFVTIPNGFDPRDFPPRCDDTQRTHFRLLYAGSLYKTRSPAKVLEAFRRFLGDVPGSRLHARFDFAGRPGPHVDTLAGPDDGDTIRYVGMLPHAQALKEMASADVNVIILSNLPGGENDTTAKVYECIGSGRPILAAVPPKGAAARVLRAFDGVRLCDPDDVDGITRAITDLYRSWLAGTLRAHRPAEALETITRQRQTARLAACLDAVAPAARQNRGSRL